LTVEEVELDPPQQDEVQVRIAAAAICHSDVHLIRGEWGGTTPVVAGHEAAGVVSAVGPGVGRVQPGDRVVVTLLRSCGHCFFCSIGRPYDCEGEFSLDRESRLRNREGVSIVHGIRTAAFAEYTVVHETQVVRIPEDMPMDRACLLACGVITGLGAVTNTVGVEAGSSVVVIGSGGVGLNSIQGAVLSGATRIIAVDLLENKLQAARHFGATHTLNAATNDIVTAVMALTGGRGADYAFVTVGSSGAMSQASRMIRRGGTAVVVGMPGNADVHFTLNAHEIVYGRRVVGSNMGSARPSVDIPRLVELYQGGRLKLDELITGRYPLDRINEAIESMERGEALRNVIIF
jgi:S-(hydroxymethyl)glutathione dehydrogenase/alcohol dehydrogenase